MTSPIPDLLAAADAVMDEAFPAGWRWSMKGLRDEIRDALLAEREAGVRAAEEMRAAAARLVETRDKNNVGMTHPIDQAIADAIRALPLPAPSSGSGWPSKVKALAWNPDNIASSIIGRYQVVKWQGRGGFCWTGPHSSYSESFDTLEAAQAAAQRDFEDRILAALDVEPSPSSGWRPISSAPKDGTVIDVWIGDAELSDVEFYCTPGTRRSPGWSWRDGKFRPLGGLPGVTMPTFVEPTHWQPLPLPPAETSDNG